MSLTPCRFFGSATGCKFGDRCRFYHDRTGGQGYYGGTSQVFGGVGSSSTQQEIHNLSAKAHQNMEAMIEAVKKDLQEWQTGGIWALSCYGPSGGKPCLPGFEEISAEELRYKYYVLNNKTPFDLSKELTTAQQARQAFTQLTPTTRNILERVIVKGERIPNSGSVFAPQSPFGVSSPQTFTTQPPTSGSIFGQPSVFGQTQNAIGTSVGSFGMPPSQNSIFGGGSSSPFGGTPAASATSPSLFGGGSTLAPQQGQGGFFGTGADKPQSIFGGAPQAAVSNQPLFGSTTFGTSPSIFGTPPNQHQHQLFQSPSQTTGTMPVQPNMIFGGAPPQQTGSIFGVQETQMQPMVPSIVQQQTVPAFGSSQQNSLFGTIQNPVQQQPPPTANVLPVSGSFFGSPSPSSTITPAAGIFQSTMSQPIMQPSIFGSAKIEEPPTLITIPKPEKKFVYSNESDLTEEELAAFRSPAFTLENIPTRPPPKSLCGL